jgi:Ni/Co efflux regulator RcnB
MKRLITSAMALSLLMGGNALAQDKEKHGGGKHQGGQQQQQQSHQGGGKHQDRAPQNRGPNPNAGHGAVNPNYRNPDRPRAYQTQERNVDRNRKDERNRNWDRNRNDNRNQNWNRNDRGHQVNRNRDRPRTFDRRAYQRNAYAHRKFRHGVYHRPPGWYYRRWSYGQILPFIFFSQNYWLNDWYYYDLPAPPYGYEWVRYGDDAILVDVRTGMILQVMYGVFY